MYWSASLELGRINGGVECAGAAWKGARAAAWRRMSAYQVRGFAFDDELLLLQVLQYRETCQYALPKQKDVWLGQCEHVVEAGTC